jgi:hypothetical protein
MTMVIIKLDVTTDASGNGSATGNGVNGVVFAVQCVDGTFDDGVDVDITWEQGDLSVPILSKDDFNTDSIYYPRVLEALNTDGSALSTHCMPIICGTPKATIAQGGNTKSGTFNLYVIDL